MDNAFVSIPMMPSVPHDEDGGAGVKCELHPLNPTMEDERDELLWGIQKMNDKLSKIGASHVIPQSKMVSHPSSMTSDMFMETYT